MARVSRAIGDSRSSSSVVIRLGAAAGIPAHGRGACATVWILNITMGSKGSSKIIGEAVAPIAALASLVRRSGDLREMMVTKRTAALSGDREDG